jgi:hypothetical protein
MHENKILAAPIENKVAEIEAAERPERIPMATWAGCMGLGHQPRGGTRR